MANILNDDYNSQTSFLTPVFTVPTNYKSSLKGDAQTASPRLVVKNTIHSISKDGDTLTVNGVKIDIGYKNILDIVNILKGYEIDIKFLDNTVGWDYPAACILDFTNKEFHEVDLTHLPYDLEVHRLFKNNTIETIRDVVIKPELVFDTKGNQKGFKCTGNFVVSVEDYTANTNLLYSVHSDTFLIKVSDKKFSTTKTDVLAKHMDKVIR